jgi:hypothetical protein
MLETRSDHVPSDRDAFLVVDAALMVQGVSAHAEQLLAIEEERAIDHSVGELLVAADAEPGRPGGFAGAIADAIAGGGEPVSKVVRPWNTFGVRMRARIGCCGPPRAALVVLETAPSRLRAVRNG